MNSTMHRRTFLKGTLGAATLTVAAAAGLLAPTRVLAAAWPKPAFEAKSMDDVAKALYGNAAGSASKDISIKAPIQAENGAVVPIAVSTKLSGVDSIAILVKENASPLVSSVALSGAEGYRGAFRRRGLFLGPHEDGQVLGGQSLCALRRQAFHRLPADQGHGGRLRRLSPASTPTHTRY